MNRKNWLLILLFTFFLIGPRQLASFAPIAGEFLGISWFHIIFTTGFVLPSNLQLVPGQIAITYAQVALFLAIPVVALWPLIRKTLHLLPPTGGGIADIPKQRRADDSMNRWPVAESLGALLLNPMSQAPFCIGITAPWGSGKSTVLNFLCERVAGRMHTVRLNAWHFQEDRQILAALMDGLLETGIPSGFKWSNIRFRLRLLWFRSRHALVALAVIAVGLNCVFLFAGRSPGMDDIYQVLQTILSYFSQLFRKLASVFELPDVGAFVNDDSISVLAVAIFALSTSKKILELLSPFSAVFKLAIAKTKSLPGADSIGPQWVKDAGLRYKFQKEFTVICMALGFGGLFRNRDIRGGLVLVVDDLDRCEPKHIEPIISTLNFIFDTKAPCFAIVGMDWERVVTGLAKSFEELYHSDDLPIASTSEKTKIAKDNAQRHLEKIIQLRIDLAKDHFDSPTLNITSKSAALPTINWWALPVTIVEAVCNAILISTLYIASIISDRYSRVLRYFKQIYVNIGKVANSLEARLIGAGGRIINRVNGVTDFNVKKITKKIFVFYLVSTLSLLFGVIYAIYFELSWTIVDIQVLYLITAGTFAVFAIFILLYVSIFHSASVVNFITKRRFELANHPASAKIAIFFLPIPLYLTLRDDSLSAASLITFYLLGSFALSPKARASSSKIFPQRPDDSLSSIFAVFAIVYLFASSNSYFSLGVFILMIYGFALWCYWLVMKPTFPASSFMTIKFRWIFEIVFLLFKLIKRSICIAARYRHDVLLYLSAFAVAVFLVAKLPKNEITSGNVVSKVATQLSSTSPESHLDEVNLIAGSAVGVEKTMPTPISLLFFAMFVLAISGIGVLVYIWPKLDWAFLDDPVFDFEDALTRWRGDINLLGLTPRAEKQLINRSRYVVTRWHVECRHPALRVKLIQLLFRRYLRNILNDEDWEIIDSRVPMSGSLLADLTLINAITFGGLLLGDLSSAQMLAEKSNNRDKILAVLASVSGVDLPLESLAYKQFALWKLYEETTPIPISWQNRRDPKVAGVIKADNA